MRFRILVHNVLTLEVYAATGHEKWAYQILISNWNTNQHAEGKQLQQFINGEWKSYDPAKLTH